MKMNAQINNQTLKEYLTFNKKDKQTLSTVDAKRYQLAKFIEDYSTDNEKRTLYHITITYKYYNRGYTEDDVNIFFRNFYIKYLLPYLHKPHKYTTTRQRLVQPLCLSFIDEHTNPHIIKSMKPVDRIRLAMAFENSIDYTAENNFNLNERKLFIEHPLHHHSIISVHPEQVQRMNKLLGTNTLVIYKNNFKDKPLTLSQELSIHNRKIIKTSHIRQCDSLTLLYASKRLYDYQEFQVYPDTLKRRNNYANKIYTGTDKSLRNIVHTRIHLDPSDINTSMHDVLKNTLAI
jgi:hypothetical protein